MSASIYSASGGVFTFYPTSGISKWTWRRSRPDRVEVRKFQGHWTYECHCCQPGAARCALPAAWDHGGALAAARWHIRDCHRSTP